MAHPEQKEFCLSVKKKFPDYFINKFVLDVGALDINGNNQFLFDECGYLGVDISLGKNIDIASKGHELLLPDACFDVIVSTECFEHDPFYEKTIKNIYRMLKPGGLFLFSCATTGRPEHGTRRTTPDDAPFTHDFGEWGDYYKNLEESDIRLVLDVDRCFSSYEFSTQHKTHDLYFWGVKAGDFVKRSDYSFLLADSSFSRTISRLKADLEDSKAVCRGVESELADLNHKIKKIEADYRTSQAEAERNRREIEQVWKSKSWQLTKPLRFAARLFRGEYQAAFSFLGDNEVLNRKNLNVGRLKNGLAYIRRGDFKGFFNRLSFIRKDVAIKKWQSSGVKPEGLVWGIMTPGHTLFIAELLADRLSKQGWACEIMTLAPEKFSHDLYIVICPQIFDRLPPGEKCISYQLEQSVSSRWFTDRYKSILESSLAVLDYSLVNLEYLSNIKISYPHVNYLPIGALKNYGQHVHVDEKKFDVTFYGDSLSSPRRRKMLDALREKFDVHVVNNMFGDDMIRLLKQSKVVVNIHYYENALLEMPRIQECLSLGVKVVSESSQDQGDYPELGSAVLFFEESSIEGMIAAVQKALKSVDDATQKSVQDSERRFAFMFDRFLVSMGLLPSSHVQSMSIPVSCDADTFGLSLPETIERRRVFDKHKPDDCVVFDGIRRRPGWIGCGLSYAAIAKHSLGQGLKSIVVMEDDVILPSDYKDCLEVIKAYLNFKGDGWHVFSGVIASLHPDAEVLAVEDFSGRTFLTINKMTSTVFNIYSESALKLLCEWDPNNLDAASNTIDRYLENQQDLRVVVMLPFFVGHREEVNSTLWGFQNTQYCKMIKASEEALEIKKDEFIKYKNRNPFSS